MLVAYYFSQIASMMRCNIETKDRGVIPVNTYVLNLACSGFGKNFSLNILEENIMSGFRENFLSIVFPAIAEMNMVKIANTRSTRDRIDYDVWDEKLRKEFDESGEMVFNFDSGTTAAIKQFRHKLLLAGAGSMNFIADEIGSNILGNNELLTTFLETYDVGKIKQKIIKNTKENVRVEEIEGRTPTNMLLFGTQAKLLDGGPIENEFRAMMSTGYGRRLFYGYVSDPKKPEKQRAEDLYDILTDTTISNFEKSAERYYRSLASKQNFNPIITVDREVTIRYLRYKIDCEGRSESFGDYEDIKKAEMVHRYYKMLKLAGSYAFVEKSNVLTHDHVKEAIQLTEDSGEHFDMIINKEGSYVKLAKFIASTDRELTHVDLMENLSFFRGSESKKRDMLSLATAYGHKNNIVIRRSYVDDIEFISGETLEETDIDDIQVSFSEDIASDYEACTIEFSELYKLVTADGFNYTAHNFRKGKRSDTHVEKGFNLLILDVDNGVSIEGVKTLLSGYTSLIATTKRHTNRKNRFRIILPMSHYLKLNKSEYLKFMENVYSWLPFECDTSTKDIARKWSSHDGNYWYNNAEMIDSTLFIERTKKAEKQAELRAKTSNMSAAERWFAMNTEVGNRSNMLLRYGLFLVDNGQTVDNARLNILSLNDKLEQGLDVSEIDRSIVRTVEKHYDKVNDE